MMLRPVLTNTFGIMETVDNMGKSASSKPLSITQMIERNGALLSDTRSHISGKPPSKTTIHVSGEPLSN